CASRAFAPPPTLPAKRWSGKWPISSASPANNFRDQAGRKLVRRTLLCVLASFILTFVILAWLLFIPLGSTIPFIMLFPAFVVTSKLVGRILGSSDGGPSNFVAAVLASSVFNVIFYAAVFFLLSK